MDKENENKNNRMVVVATCLYLIINRGKLTDKIFQIHFEFHQFGWISDDSTL